MTTRHGSATVTLPSDREILITRTFEAPAALVWDAITQPRHLLRWWGPDYCPLVACDVDFRVGGAWRYLCRDMDGNELGWHGTYRDIDHGERIVSTEVFEGFPDAESVNTMTLDRARRRHDAAHAVLHATNEYRDGHVASGHGGRDAAHLQPARRPARRRRTRPPNGSAGSPAASPIAPTRCRTAAWDNPAPCDGWTARDVVDHLVTWVPGFMSSSAGVEIEPGPGGRDRSGRRVDQPRRPAPGVARRSGDRRSREIDGGPIGKQTVESAIGMIVRRRRRACTRGTSPGPPGSTSRSTPTSSPRC